MFLIGIWNPDAIKIVMENLFRFFFSFCSISKWSAFPSPKIKEQEVGQCVIPFILIPSAGFCSTGLTIPYMWG